jgi:RNA:NAD 2'-phosphotransferase (TPT1/KptA family)
VSDSAGNKAPLLQNNSLKLSDNKLYVADKIPPEFSAQVIEGGTRGGWFLFKN